VGDRLRAVAMRLAFGAGLVAAFALGSVGAFLAFDWPPLLREIVLGYLLAFLALRLALVVGGFLLSPGFFQDRTDQPSFVKSSIALTSRAVLVQGVRMSARPTLWLSSSRCWNG
jgi:hypothetical protein